MNEEPRPPDDPLAPLLAAYDEALAAGHAQPPPVPPELADRFRNALSVLRLLERVWPRQEENGAADPPPNGAARRVDRFEVLRALGGGSIGLVYLARDPQNGRRVALKTPRPDRLQTAEIRNRFLHEGRAAVALDHPNIVPVHEAGEAGPLCYIVSAYCEGPSLAAWMRGHARPHPCRLAASLTADLAAGVAHAHGRGVLHGGLTPGNVFLHAPAGPAPEADATLRPMISDFGLAKLLRAEGPNALPTEPAYAAPEQAVGRAPEAGPPADVYSLGAVLYELLTGRPPFQGATPPDTLRLVVSKAPEPPRRRRKDVPRGLEKITLTCLEKEPALRYGSAAALEADLRRWLQGQAPLGRPEWWLRRVGRGARRRPALFLAAVLLVLIAGFGLIALPYLDPDRAATAATANLARGDKVVLAGESGAPAWFRWEAGGKAAKGEVGPDGAFHVHAEGLSLLELLPDPGRDSYRIRAQVRHDKNDGFGQVGLYFTRREYRTPGGTVESFLQLTYNDLFSAADIGPQELRGKAPELNTVDLRPRFWSDSPSGTDWNLLGPGRGPELFKPARGGRWRDLVVRVTPDGVAGWWEDGQPVGEMLSATELVREAAEALESRRKGRPNEPGDGGVEPAFTPRGGLGLYVENGAASFRNVVVEPLGD